jgi:tetratricopeptide (TPR) repeat protein
MGRAREGLVLLDGAQQDTPVTFYYSEGTAFAEAYLLAGRMAEAAAQAQRALDHAREKGQRALEADALYMVAEVASRGEDLGGAEQRSRGAMSLADELGMRPLVAHCHLGLGKLYRRTGKREQAQEHLTTATTMYREMGMTYWLEKAEAESRS